MRPRCIPRKCKFLGKTPSGKAFPLGNKFCKCPRFEAGMEYGEKCMRGQLKMLDEWIRLI